MRRALYPILAALLACSLVPSATAITMSINASPAQVHVGDVVILTGSITGVKTIAVYLFVSGPGLNPRGVTLENLNIPAGRGLFTTAPVNMADGSWQYAWDTSLILGDLRPGKYTLNVVSSPLDQFRYAQGEYATIEIEFLPSRQEAKDVPLPPLLPLAALFITAGSLILIRGRCST